MNEAPMKKLGRKTRMETEEYRPIKLMAGLGNPEEAYARTYHNVGRTALEVLAKNEGASWKKAGMYFEYCRLGEVILVRPLTFMNESGAAIKAAVKRFSVHPEEIMIMHDESDLPLGTVRYSFGKNAAGHKGVLSIMQALGTKEFWRARIGVRDPKNKKPAIDFVLKKIGVADQEKLKAAYREISEKIIALSALSGR